MNRYLAPIFDAAVSFGLSHDRKVEQTVRAAVRDAPPDKTCTAVVEALARAVEAKGGDELMARRA